MLYKTDKIRHEQLVPCRGRSSHINGNVVPAVWIRASVDLVMLPHPDNSATFPGIPQGLSLGLVTLSSVKSSSAMRSISAAVKPPSDLKKKNEDKRLYENR